MRESDRVVPPEEFTIPGDYVSIFRNKLLIITGVGRSGTTVVGKVVGSLKPIYYLFEPVLMRLMPFLNLHDKSNQQLYSRLLRSLLFEDYFLQLVHGRNFNFNTQDNSYVGNYISQSDIEKRWNKLRRRQDVIDYLETEHALFVLKIPNFQPLSYIAQQIFCQPRFIHIIRNGNDVVSSAINRGWYTDVHMNTAVVDWVMKREDKQNCNIPWYLDVESQECFPDWNQVTRAASIWRSLTQTGITFCTGNLGSCTELKYEDFVQSPTLFIAQFENAFGVKSTDITRQHLDSIKSHKLSQYPAIYKQIEKPEHDKFMLLMERLGYPV